MAPMNSWDNINRFPRATFIDLTRDDDEDDDQDEDGVEALLEKFTKQPTVNESRPLKRKSPHDDSPDVKVQVNGTTQKEPLFEYNKSTTVNNGVHHSAVGQWASSATGRGISSERALKVESRASTPARSSRPPQIQLPLSRKTTPTRSVTPQNQVPRAQFPQVKLPLSRSTTPARSVTPHKQVPWVQIPLSRTTTPVRPSIPSHVQAPQALPPLSRTTSTSSAYASASESKKSTSKERSIKSNTRSPSVMPEATRPSSAKSRVMVVVPPPPSTPGSLSKRKMPRRIQRLSVSSDSQEESDPDEPKGIKQKYYPLEMYELQAERGRYPAARTVNRDAITLPTRPITSHQIQSRALRSGKIYLKGLLLRKLHSIQGPPVTMAKDWDGSGSLVTNFEFTNKYKLAQGVMRVPEEFNGGCPCGLQCDPEKCKCLSKEEDSEELMVPYEFRNSKLLLRDSFIKKKAMIYECSSHCGCTKNCWNRLVQHGRSIKLEIFHTGNRGFGLRSPDYIHRGQFIDTYLGEVITSAEAELREDAAGSKNSPSYLFSLDWFPSQNSNSDSDSDDVEEQDYYVVDGERFGGPSRFMNHSCNPNCKMFPVSTHHGDERIYDLAFFALRDIPPGIELTFDYNPHLSGEVEADPSAVKCLCGETKCRGQLWPNQRKSSNI